MSKAMPVAPAAEAEPFQVGRVLTVTGGHAVHDTYSAFLPPLLPLFIENLALSKTEAGLLTVFYQVPSLLQPFIGHAADRVSLRYVVILTPAITGTAMSLLGVAPDYGYVALLLLISGLSSAILHAVASVMAGRLSGASLGRGMGFWMVGGELGRTVGPIAIAAAVQSWGLRGTPWLMLGGWLASIVLYLRLKDVTARPSEVDNGLSWRQALRRMGPFLVPLVALVAARSFTSAALTTYLPVFLTGEGAALWFASVSLSILEAAGVAGALLGGSLSDRLGRRLMLFVSLGGTPLLMLAFLAITGWGRFPLLLLLGLVSLSNTPVIMALVQESFPDSRALANGVYLALSFLIRSGVVVVVGGMGDLWGMHSAFTVSAFISLLGLPFLLLLPSRQRVVA